MSIRSSILLAVSFALFGCSTSERQSPSRQFSGVWLYEFEGSSFIEGATAVPKVRVDYKKTSWLNYDPAKMAAPTIGDDYVEPINCYPIRAYAITFIGHKKIEPHGSGHMGLWPSEVIVDRMIAAKPLAPPFCYDD